MNRSAVIILISLFTLTACNLLAQSVHYTIDFKKPYLTETKDGYTEIRIEDCFNYGEEGTPLLPWFGLKTLIGQGQEISGVTIISSRYSEYVENIIIKPSPRFFPLSKGTPEGYEPTPDEKIYGSEDPYPESLTGNIQTQFLAGHSVGMINICPIIYIPAENKVKFLEEITIRVDTRPSEKAAASQDLLRNTQRLNKKLKQLVNNPGFISSYQYENTRSYPEYDILLITNNALLPDFEEYIDFKVSTGFLVKTMTTENIYSSYSGQDDQEKIRNCIIDSYTNDGIMAVILGGDADPSDPSDNIIPHRGLTALDEADIAADMYYACLDGNWNDDGDSYWGEPGEDDLFAEVLIGRICVDEANEIQNHTHKLYMYQNEPVIADLAKALMIGESLDAITWGGDSKDEVADGSSNLGFTTVGFTPNFTVSELYERDMSWNKNDVFNQFNNTGVNLLNHLGHSNVTYNMKMSNSDLTTSNFTNNGLTRGYVIGYSQGCYNGSFDNRNSSGWYISSDCFAEKITTIETAEVASIGNSRYGWYSPGSTAGPSQYFDRQFFDAIFGEDLTMIGEANEDSKEDNASMIASSEYLRWCAYELNVFGDPTMDIWTAAPTPINASYLSNVPMGTAQINFQTDAPYARICLMQNDSVIGRDIADASGDLNLNLFQPLTSADTIFVSIIAHDRTRHQGTIMVITNQPYLVYSANLINDSLYGNNDGFVDYSETVKMTLWIENIGLADASNIDVILRTDDPYITITDSSENYGSIPAGQTVSIPDAFEFTASDDIPDEHEILFEVEAIGSDSWTSYFSLEAHAPFLVINDYIIVDSITGNGNGMLDPGETVDIHIGSSNTGQSATYDIVGSISSYNNLLTILSANYTIDTLEPSQSGYSVYTISIDPIANIGMNFELSNELVAGEYTATKTFIIKVGMICEDWETGDFSSFNWYFGGDTAWNLTTNNIFEGVYSAESGIIGDDQSSELLITLNVLGDDSISFYRKVSSEANYDELTFYIDDVKMDAWSGDVSYERVAFPVGYGVHTFKWEYKKDEGYSSGMDCALLDYIQLPYTYVPHADAGPDQSVCAGDSVQLDGSASNYTEMYWTTEGTGHFNDSSLIDPIYFPSTDDISSGSVELVLHANHNMGANINDKMLTDIVSIPGTPDKPEGPEYVDLLTTSTSEYTTFAVPGAAEYSWTIEPEDAGIIEGSDITGHVTWNTTYLGYADIMVKSMNECGESANSESIEVFVDNTTGIINPGLTSPDIKIMPNPASQQVRIIVSTHNTSDALLKIFNNFGEEVYSHSIKLNTGDNKIIIDLSAFSNGVYFCTVISGYEKTNKKLIVIK